MFVESYDSTGSIPTTDVSMETQATQESMYPSRQQPVPHNLPPSKPEEDPFISPASHQNGVPNGYVDRAEDLRKQLNYSGIDPSERHVPPVQYGSTVAITTNGDVVTTNLGQDYPPFKTNSRQDYPPVQHSHNHHIPAQGELILQLIKYIGMF